MYINTEEHLERYVKYFNYYLPRLHKFGDNVDICAIDDGSDPKWFKELGKRLDRDILIEKVGYSIPKNNGKGYLKIYTFPTNLGRPHFSMPAGWYRSATYSSIIADKCNYEKLILIESDTYILTDRLFEFIANTTEGWHSTWWREIDLPETCLTWLHRGSFHQLERYWKLGEKHWYRIGLTEDQYAPEIVFPITNVHKEFFGIRDRDEYKELPQGLDYVANINALESFRFNTNQKSKWEMLVPMLETNDPLKRLDIDHTKDYSHYFEYADVVDNELAQVALHKTDNGFEQDNFQFNVEVNLLDLSMRYADIFYGVIREFIKEFIKKPNNYVEEPSGTAILYPHTKQLLQDILKEETNFRNIDNNTFKTVLLDLGFKRAFHKMTKIEGE